LEGSNFVFEKNNLQIFNELVLLVVKMQSCGDAKKGGGGGGYSIKMTGLSGCRISRQFFAKTTTSATTLRFRLNFGFFIK
jgi:hypothetical protein